MTTAAPARPPRSTSISTRLTLVILPLVIVPLLAMGVAAYLRSQQLLRTAATAQLSSAVAAEAKVLLDWSRARQDRISLTAQSAALRPAGGDAAGRADLDCRTGGGAAPARRCPALGQRDPVHGGDGRASLRQSGD